MPTRNELLAEHYLKVAGIAAVSVDRAGAISAQPAASMEIPAVVVSFCCMSGDEARLARIAEGCRGNQAAVAAQLEQLAGDLRIGLTPHAVVVQRALAAVDAVNAAIERLQSTGGLSDINRAFKAARKEMPSLRYFDYLHAHKAAMLEALARGAAG